MHDYTKHLRYTNVFICVVVSCGKYDFWGLVSGCFNVVVMVNGHVSLSHSLRNKIPKGTINDLSHTFYTLI